MDGRLLAVQGPLVAFQLVALLPMIELGDRVPASRPPGGWNGGSQRRPGEPVAMIGVLKPSLHFYTRQVVLYEGKSKSALVNLADRLSHEQRQDFKASPSTMPTAQTRCSW